LIIHWFVFRAKRGKGWPGVLHVQKSDENPQFETKEESEKIKWKEALRLFEQNVILVPKLANFQWAFRYK